MELIGTVFTELLTGEVLTSPMPEGGTFHFAREFDELCALSLDETVKVVDLLRRLRALSFPPYRNAYFMEGGGECTWIFSWMRKSHPCNLEHGLPLRVTPCTRRQGASAPKPS